MTAGAEEKPLNAQQRVNQLASRLENPKQPWRKCYEEMEKLVEDDFFKTNAQFRLPAYQKMAGYCLFGAWTAMHRYDEKLINEKYPVLMPLVIESAEYTVDQKLQFMDRYINKYFAGLQMYEQGEKYIKDFLSRTKFENSETEAGYMLVLADLYDHWDRQDLRLKAVRDAYAKSIKKGGPVFAKLLAEIGENDDALKVAETLGDEYHVIRFLNDNGGIVSNARERALAYVISTNSLASRFALFADYLSKSHDEISRKALAVLLAAGDEKIAAEIKNPEWLDKGIIFTFSYADYPWTAELYKFAEKAPEMEKRLLSSPAARRRQIITYGAVGDKTKAIALCDKYLADDKAKATAADKARYTVYKSILKSGEVGHIPEGLTKKEEAELIRSCGRQAMVWGMFDFAEKLEKTYRGYFVDYPERRLVVKWFDRPVRNITDWREIYPNLEKQMCDRPFEAQLDLTTDVATGRNAVETTDKDSKNAMMEVTSCCDPEGLHIFLKVEDPNARLVENGFAGGITTEMYFAPGFNQAYYCFGSTPREGVNFCFATTYDNLNTRRVDMFSSRNRNCFNDEIEFTDKDYVLHLFFKWDDFYRQLPESGTDWKFECLAWGTKSCTWGGSQGVHHVSNWGNLRFELTKAQITAIRRGLVMRSYRSWEKIPVKGRASSLSFFEKWQDPEVGDPAFFAACLNPLKEELMKCREMVKADMSDDDVNYVFVNGCYRWMGLEHEIDLLRKNYLKRKLCE